MNCLRCNLPMTNLSDIYKVCYECKSYYMNFPYNPERFLISICDFKVYIHLNSNKTTFHPNNSIIPEKILNFKISPKITTSQFQNILLLL